MLNGNSSIYDTNSIGQKRLLGGDDAMGIEVSAEPAPSNKKGKLFSRWSMNREKRSSTTPFLPKEENGAKDLKNINSDNILECERKSGESGKQHATQTQDDGGPEKEKVHKEKILDRLFKLKKSASQVYKLADNHTNSLPHLNSKKEDSDPPGIRRSKSATAACAHDNCKGDGGFSRRLKYCTSCFRVAYCTEHCKITHWPTHKLACKQINDSHL